MKTAIIIPARYGSTRFPGKPLAQIAGRSMLARVVEVARQVADHHDHIDVIVTTEDQRIAEHCAAIGAVCHITPADCPTGSDRVLAAAKMADKNYDFLINLQGDAPFTPPAILESMIAALAKHGNKIEVITPVHRLRWDDLDRLRAAKKTTPFSGTTCIRDNQGYARWFSKNIIPAIRAEDKMRAKSEHSPVFQHIGVYGFRRDILEKFVSLPQGIYEQLEGLEQLRLLENNITIFTVKTEFPPGTLQAGIDSPEDLARAEALLAAQGGSA